MTSKFFLMALLLASQAALAKANSKTKATSVPAVKSSVGAPKEKAISCEPLRWVVGRKGSIKSLMSDFREMPREQLIRMSWGELLENRPDSLAMPMLHYLANTTENSSARGYFLAIGYLVLDDKTPSEAVQKWPARLPARKSPMTAEQLCQFYQTATHPKYQAAL